MLLCEWILHFPTEIYEFVFLLDVQNCLTYTFLNVKFLKLRLLYDAEVIT